MLREPVRQNSWVLQTLKSTGHLLPQFAVSCRSDSSSEVNSSCCQKSDATLNLEYRAAASAKIIILQILSSGSSLMFHRKCIGPRMELSRTTESHLILGKGKTRSNTWAEKDQHVKPCCYSMGSPRPIKSPSNFINYNRGELPSRLRP